jgi:hypothetical protein
LLTAELALPFYALFLTNPADIAPEGEPPLRPLLSNPFDGGIAPTGKPLGARASPAEIGAADAALLGALMALTLPEAEDNG